jgi:hypothetical protein
MWSAAMDVGVWLRSLGLGDYEESFRDNKINADLLPRLTNDDLNANRVYHPPRLAGKSTGILPQKANGW